MAPTAQTNCIQSVIFILPIIFLLLSLQTADATLYKFATKDDPNTTCILLDANFTIDFQAYDVNHTLISSAEITSEDNVTLAGSCGTAPQLNIRFDDGTNWWFIFRRARSSTKVTLDQLVQFIPDQVFGSGVHGKDVVSFDDPGTTEVGTTDTSFRCRSTKRVVYNSQSAQNNFTVQYDVTVTFDGVQLQAFQVTDGQFSNATECYEDNTTTTPATTTPFNTTTTPFNTTTTPQNTTTTPQNTTTTPFNTTTTPQNTTTPPQNSTTTPAPITTPSPDAPINSYSVADGNTTCISLTGAMTLRLVYPVNDSKIAFAVVPVPAKYTVGGDCGSPNSTTEHLVISFLDGWKLDFTFSVIEDDKNDLEAGGKLAYGISNLTIVYVIDEEHFPDCILPEGAQLFVSPDSEEPDFPAKSSADAGYYKCDSSVTLALSDDIKVKTTDLKFKAFNDNGSADFAGDADECSADDDSDNLVPILVGVILGAIVILIIVFYLVSRWKKKRQQEYERI